MSKPYSDSRHHGGPDALGVPLHDFSTNSNACGPCPSALVAVRAADSSRYPDPSYGFLRQQLAEFHAVQLDRIVLAASASEFIFRITSLCALQGGSGISLPRCSYGDYAEAAGVWGLQTVDRLADAQLHWACEPSSPLGTADERLPALMDLLETVPGHTVLDRAYEPLRLSGRPVLTHAQLQSVWQLYSPNKALGLTGIRGAYAIAPVGAGAHVQALEQLCPSWPLGVHGVALLQAWTQAETRAWLADSRAKLSEWKTRQVAMCEALGWHCLPSDTNFYGVQPVLPPSIAWDEALSRLRAAGIKLRDTASFGLPGHARISVQPPERQVALRQAWTQLVKACR